METLIGKTFQGSEYAYDLPTTATQEEREIAWQFPIKIFKANDGIVTVSNAAEIDARGDQWLRRAGLPRTACGHWYFTWNAFRVECGSASARDMATVFDMGPDGLYAGFLINDPDASKVDALRETVDSANVHQLVAVLDVDPEKVKRDRAERDVVVGEIVRKPVSLNAALKTHASEKISGTKTLTFELDADGRVRKRKSHSLIKVELLGGVVKTQIVDIVLERRRIGTR